MKTIRVFAPATVANFVVGFDSLVASLECVNDNILLGDIVTISDAPSNTFEVTGSFAHKLPVNNDENLVIICRNAFNHALKNRGGSLFPVHLQLEKRLPINSGLGSSASSIVASLVALNRYYDTPFSSAELLQIAGEMEGIVSSSPHFDNVGPSLLGGLQLILPDNRCETLPWFDNWFLVIHYPDIEVSTKMAREILPKQVTLSDAINYSKNFTGFVHALYTKNQKSAASLLVDNLIQPYRSKLIPCFEKSQKIAMDTGAIAFGISGSGSSLFSVVDSFEKATSVQKTLSQLLPKTKDSFTHLCKVSPMGARILECQSA